MNLRKIPVAYSVKGVLARGIEEIRDAEEDEYGFLCRARQSVTDPFYLYIPKKYWFESLDEAKAVARKMIDAKLRGIEKQAKKLKTLRGILS